MKIETIHFTNIERLVEVETQRRKLLWERKSKKPLWLIMAGLIAVFYRFITHKNKRDCPKFTFEQPLKTNYKSKIKLDQSGQDSSP